ncbi:MAG: hypothetical protein M3395_00995 [Chloroflexota bacterium]|nr:hypothetical protein [Chloroflexota bacterium]MDQ3690067.1 hypothetical protein [Chloroflexota bacterium]
MTDDTTTPLASRTPASEAAVQERRDRIVALLLASAAVLAAILATRASFLAGEAAGHWQQAVRSEIKRAAATVEDVRYLYTSEAPFAYRIAEARVREQALRDAATDATEEARAALVYDADVQKALADALLPASEIAADPRYELAEGGFDLAMRLADNRARFPELVAVDPGPEQAAGDRASDKAVMLVAAGLPVGLTLFLGALATAFRGHRRRLLAAGAMSLATATMLALGIEILA